MVLARGYDGLPNSTGAELEELCWFCVCAVSIFAKEDHSRAVCRLSGQINVGDCLRKTVTVSILAGAANRGHSEGIIAPAACQEERQHQTHTARHLHWCRTGPVASWGRSPAWAKRGAG